jgi:hypothetical protein
MRGWISFIGLQGVQILSELLSARAGLTHVIKYTSSVFVLVRLVQLVFFGALKSNVARLSKSKRTLNAATYCANVALWTYILFRLVSKILQAVI